MLNLGNLRIQVGMEMGPAVVLLDLVVGVLALVDWVD